MTTRETGRGGTRHRLSPNPRRHALEVISQALSQDAPVFAQVLLEERLSHAPLCDEDKRLAANLTYGVIRRRATLDAVLAAYSNRPIEAMDSAVLQILRLGIYQILFLERVPAHAAVDESVGLARATGKAHATGFVNAVLRSIARDVHFTDEPHSRKPRESFALSPGRACVFPRPVLPAPTEFANYLEAALSHPRWLLVRWLARYGTSRTRELCEIGNETPALYVRPNALRLSPERLVEILAREDVKATASPSGRTLRLPPHVQVRQLKTFRDGLFLVQDDNTAAVAPFLSPAPGERVLDLCAAPGGKTCHIAELMRNRGRIVAVDSSGSRLARVVENVQRMDLRIIATVEADGADFATQNRGAFDRVLLDAPCSNTGVLRRRVEARWRLSDTALAARVKVQRRLLEAALQALKPGATLVYATCTIEPEENGELIRSVLAAIPEFHLDAEQFMLPQRDGGDGLYMARILRAGAKEGNAS